MLRLVLRRAWAQRRLLTAVVLLVTVAATLAGFYSLLVGVTGPRAFSEQVQRTEPDQVDVTAYAVGLASRDLDSTDRTARSVLTRILGPLHPSLTSTATSEMRRFGGSDRLGYLATTGMLADQVTLTSGRWPRAVTTGPVQALAPDAAAQALRLHVGQRIRLGPGAGLGRSPRRAVIVVVGTFRGLPRAAARTDPLSGAGVETAYNTGGVTAPAFGPFLVRHHDFLATGFDVAGLRVDAEPDLDGADRESLRAAAGSLGSASTVLSDRVGGAAGITRVGSELPDTWARLQAQDATTRSAVLVALLLDGVLGVAALVLAGRLVAESRRTERQLLTSMGVAPAQHLRSALAEALLLAGAAAVVAVPAAATGYAAVTHLPGLAAAGLTAPSQVTLPLVLTTVAGAALLAVVLVVSPLLSAESGALATRRQLFVRSAVDALFLAVAAVGWWQLHTRSAAVEGVDTVLALAPVLVLASISLVAGRALPAVFARLAALGSRSRGLLPVALDPGAVRANAGAALALLTLASAAATFGVALHATWHRSQEDQADLGVGTDLALSLHAPPTAADARSVHRAVDAGGGVVSPVVTSPIALGHFFGESGDPPELVAVDTQGGGAPLRGRPPSGETWNDVVRRLAPPGLVEGVPLPDSGGGVTVEGHAPAGVALTVTPSFVVEDSLGFRSTLDAAPLPVDGLSHALRWPVVPPPGLRIVALHLTVADAGSRGRARNAEDPLSVVLRVRGRPGADTSWQVRTLGPADGTISSPSVSVHGGHGGTVVTTHVLARPAYLTYEQGDIVATAFDQPAAVPVAVSQELADATGAGVGSTLSGTIGDTALTLRVAEVIPTVPSAPGRLAVLADLDTVSRALIVAGHLEPPVDAFWVSRPGPRTPALLRSLGLADVTTRREVATELARGPMQITVPVAYLTVAGSSALLLVAGAGLVVSADRRRRTAEVARLRALGLRRTAARRLVFVQHGVLLVALVLVGAVIGGISAVALDALLVRSEQGTAPVPGAVLAWPWSWELALSGGLVLACLAISALGAREQVSRSDTTRLGEAE